MSFIHFFYSLCFCKYIYGSVANLAVLINFQCSVAIFLFQINWLKLNLFFVLFLCQFSTLSVNFPNWQHWFPWRFLSSVSVYSWEPYMIPVKTTGKHYFYTYSFAINKTGLSEFSDFRPFASGFLKWGFPIFQGCDTDIS